MTRAVAILRALGRILRRAATALSFLLLLATLAGWAWCRREGAALYLWSGWPDGHADRRAAWSVACSGGDVGAHYLAVKADAGRSQPGWPRPGAGCTVKAYSEPLTVTDCYDRDARYFHSIGSGGAVWARGGVVLAWAEGSGPPAGPWEELGPAVHRRLLWIALPCWMAALACSVLPGWRAWAFVRRRRGRRECERRGLCPDCGYDLRATPDAGGPLLGRCPECGRETAPT